MTIGVLMERRIQWPAMLAAMGVGWLAATSVTALGMYMVACHAHGSSRPSQHQAQWMTHDSSCVGRWTIGEGHLVLVVGSLLNMVLLVTMLVLLVHERRALTVIQDPPPDYETLVKAETPPPSFAEVQLTHLFPAPASTPTYTAASTPTYTPSIPESSGKSAATNTTTITTILPSAMV